jgi:hypothetical protein
VEYPYEMSAVALSFMMEYTFEIAVTDPLIYIKGAAKESPISLTRVTESNWILRKVRPDSEQNPRICLFELSI